MDEKLVQKDLGKETEKNQSQLHILNNNILKTDFYIRNGKNL